MKKFSLTTKGSSHRTSPTKKRIGALTIVGVSVLLALWLLPYVFAGLAAIMITPIQRTSVWLSESTGNLPMYFRDRASLIAELHALEEELALQQGVEHSIGLLTKENEELRGLLNDDGEERILAAVISRPNALPYDVISIDQGTRDGVKLNAPVYIGENRVIGRVAKVFSQSALVELVTTPGAVTSVFIVGPDIYTNAIGMGGGQLRVGVPQGINLQVGDSVVLPAVQSGVFGTISHLESLPTRPEQYGFVSTNVPLQSMRYVAVGSTQLEPVTFAEAEAVVDTVLSDLFTVPVPEGVLVLPERATSTATTSLESVATGTVSSSPEL